MIDGRSVLAIIPARGGSKGVPDKNVRLLQGKPLLAWTIEAALQSKYIDRLILSSDSDKILAIGREHGCETPFKRPAELSSDSAGSAEVVLHALKEIGPSNLVVLLQPTSPLRTVEDIDATIELCVRSGASTATTITTAHQSPFHMYFRTDQNDSPSEQYKRILPATGAVRRQDQPQTYILNGAVYVLEANPFQASPYFVTDKTVYHLMPEERSVDIDTVLDFQYAELLLENQRSSK